MRNIRIAFYYRLTELGRSVLAIYDSADHASMGTDISTA